MTTEHRLTRLERLTTRLIYLVGAVAALLTLVAVLGPTVQPAHAASSYKTGRYVWMPVGGQGSESRYILDTQDGIVYSVAGKTWGPGIDGWPRQLRK